ncbi:PREDICTED: uncharacterized protein LOC104799214 [Tarenaya hassleriana]|uniref:uncharacterized protein LOC104799214 n=1 Tax=Tarenaya hassleriana TaxID=28532 RepID=UPI00053C97F0|nr:PREDICTED: uncharacterized protein LOC104799214 [Tarenaya hassleriana]XP_010519922.1 PREDICTED: uncharacterized protein LOC104799214 [Tarenaya hassleriana]XP_010519923.1 PREDICTED: uncharacterized protein LOC104799214 [Tarenaya hassleriana]XP_010519925.1 PREDICTED: uncharacterized protein LOC104799214 [Tarenaya hassleriana]
MLRKRSRSNQKHQMVSASESFPVQSEVSRVKNHRKGSFFSIPSLFVGLSNKGTSDNDPAWSPNSPLDFRLFSGFGAPFAGSSKAAHHVHQKSWDSGKVGLSIVDSLEDRTDESGKVLRSSESKNILFAPGMRFGYPICPKGVEKAHEQKNPCPKDYPVFPKTLAKTPTKDDELGSVFETKDNPIKQDPVCSLSSYGAKGSSSGNSEVGKDTYQAIASKPDILPHLPSLDGSPLKQSLESLSGCMDPNSESEIELSEAYTCIISHGPNPKTTHFYGDRVLENWDTNALNEGFRYKEQKGFAVVSMPFTKLADVVPPETFLSFCTSCSKGLQGKAIYMYRGCIAFCSEECRSKEILADERMDEAAVAAKSVVSDNGCKDLSGKGKK